MTSFTRSDSSRIIRAPRGREISCKSWQTEAALRMLMNNLDPDVAERPAELVVYGGIGRAARNWECFDKIVEVLRRLNMAPEKVGKLFQARTQPLRDPKGNPLVCEFCTDLRFVGRTGVYEIFEIDDETVGRSRRRVCGGR